MLHSTVVIYFNNVNDFVTDYYSVCPAEAVSVVTAIFKNFLAEKILQ